MVESGFLFQPLTDTDDHVVCTCCEISLDGWEKTDDPKYFQY